MLDSLFLVEFVIIMYKNIGEKWLWVNGRGKCMEMNR